MSGHVSMLSRFGVPDGRTLVIVGTDDSVRLSFEDTPERVLELPRSLARAISDAIRAAAWDPNQDSETERRCRSPNGMKARR